MSVYYKFKSAKDFDSIPVDGHFITVGHLKERIFEAKQLGKGTDYDLLVINAQTNEEYLDEATLIPKSTSVLIRRLPGQPRMPIVTAPDQKEPVLETKPESVAKTSLAGADKSVLNYADGLEYDEFGNDLYEIPEVAPVISSNPVQDAPPPSKADEDSKIQSLINTPALGWKQTSDGFGCGRGFGRGMGGRMGGRGFGGGGFEWRTPPEGYVCHRCNMPGHFIQHCPTNGDPNFDIKRTKPPTGILKSMLIATPDGSYALPSGAVAVMQPNVAAFEKEIEKMPISRNVVELPPELHCPLCKEVMKDAVITGKCCYQSFCDKCIRDHIISKAECVCGIVILADDLVPNGTMRDAISRILESKNSSLHKASKEGQAPLHNVETKKMQGTAKHDESPIASQEALEERKMKDVPVSANAHGTRSMKEPAPKGSAQPAGEDMQHKYVPVEAGKKKKKKKVNLCMSAAEMQWGTPQDLVAESYMMPLGPPYNPYWNDMQPGMQAYMGPYGGAMPPYMGYGVGPLNVPGMMPPPVPPRRDLAELGMRMYDGLPIMSREEFEARKAEIMWKRELESRGGRELFKDEETRTEVSSSGDVSSMKLKCVRTFVVHALFILSIFCITTGKFVHSGNLLATYIVGGAINNLGKSVLRNSSIHDSKKNRVDPFLFSSFNLLV